MRGGERDREKARRSLAKEGNAAKAVSMADLAAIEERLAALDRRINRHDDIIRSIEWRVDQVESALRPRPSAIAAAQPVWLAVPSTDAAPAPIAEAESADALPAAHAFPAVQPEPVVTREEARVEPAPLPFADAGDRETARSGAPVRAARAWSAADIERLASGRGLAWVGGLALVIGAMFFLSLAFSRGWIGSGARVGIGLVAGVAMIAGGAWVLERRDPLVGRVLVAVGIGVWTLALFAATRLYDLAPVAVGLGRALVGFAAAAAVAIRADAEELALFGVIAAIAAPPVLGAEPTGVTVGYLAAALLASTAISLRRVWPWLAGAAFLMSAPQFSVWIDGRPPLAVALIGVGGFWLLHAGSATGQGVQARRRGVREGMAGLLVLNAIVVGAAGEVLLDGPHTAWRGLFFALLALAHLALSLAIWQRFGERNGFAITIGEIGAAALAIAIPLQFDGAPVAIAWAIVGAGVAWVSVKTSARAIGWTALGYGLLAIGHLLAFEYPLGDLARWPADLAAPRPAAIPFLNANALTLLILLAAFGIAAWTIRSSAVRVGLCDLAAVAVVAAVPHELSGLAQLAAWCALTVVAVAATWPLFAAAFAPDADGEQFVTLTALGVLAPALTFGSLALTRLLAIDIPLARFEVRLVQSGVPFTDHAAAAAAIVALGILGVAAVAPGARVRAAALAALFALAAYLVPFELAATPTVVAWSLLAVGALLVANADRAARDVLTPVGVALLALAGALILALVAPPTRLFVHAAPAPADTPIWSVAIATLAIVAALAAAAWIVESPALARGFGVAAGAFAV